MVFYLRKQLTPHNLVILLVLLGTLTSVASLAEPRRYAGEEPIVFEANSGDTTDAFAGSFEVPEYRGAEASRTLKLRYVRFPATTDTPGAPIVYLSGGPGGSGIGTARWRRFPLFQALRAHADVIALDQRGTGSSDAPPECESSRVVPTDTAMTDGAYAQLYRDAVEECVTFWRDAAVDLRGYTTAESVLDLSDLRAHLGAEKLSLWGISYGSHLALAAMKAIPGEIDRVILASVEGLDQTVKLPSRTDDYLARIGQENDITDLPAMMRRVNQRLLAEPVLLELKVEDREPVPFLLQRRDLQTLSSAAIADPAWAKRMIAVYRGADENDFEMAAELLPQILDPGAPITLRAMPVAMDRASGISDKRLAQVKREARTSVLGDYLNFPMPHILPLLGNLDLGDEFRRDPVSSIPSLVFTGTLDGRTYPDGQAEAVAGLKALSHVMVHGAGHNLFTYSPRVLELMLAFVAGEPVDTTVIEAPPAQ